MLKTAKKENSENLLFNLNDLEINKLGLYKDLLRKYKKEGNKDKVYEYEQLIKKIEEKKDI